VRWRRPATSVCGPFVRVSWDPRFTRCCCELAILRSHFAVRNGGKTGIRGLRGFAKAGHGTRAAAGTQINADWISVSYGGASQMVLDLGLWTGLTAAGGGAAVLALVAASVAGHDAAAVGADRGVGRSGRPGDGQRPSGWLGHEPRAHRFSVRTERHTAAGYTSDSLLLLLPRVL